ncbi:hypothetical protein [Kitasatospora sp. NPDC056531]|uniref:hypothetical protein n=1 Tax=Kitasatospora sp. NPDC056531 TaxID=3345856 RepID=UPI0036C67317
MVGSPCAWLPCALDRAAPRRTAPAVLSSGERPAGWSGHQPCEPPVGTPFAPYQTMKLLTTALRDGGSTLAVPSGSPTLGAHAIRRTDGTLAVVIVNKDPQHSQQFHLDLPGSYRVQRTLAWHQGDMAPTVHRGPASASLAPYSAAVILLAPRRWLSGPCRSDPRLRQSEPGPAGTDKHRKLFRHHQPGAPRTSPPTGSGRVPRTTSPAARRGSRSRRRPAVLNLPSPSWS